METHGKHSEFATPFTLRLYAMLGMFKQLQTSKQCLQSNAWEHHGDVIILLYNAKIDINDKY